MVTTEPTDLRALTRRAYERGRWGRAAREGTAVVPLAGISLVWGSFPTVTILVAGVLALLIIGLRARGELAGRAAFAGAVAGLAPMLLPLVLHQSGWCCSGLMTCDSLCYVACVGGGVVGGAIVGVRAIAGEPRPVLFMGVAGVVALLVGSLGCVVSGAAGVMGMAAALAASAVPVAMIAGVASRR